jgi:hypothetical protein
LKEDALVVDVGGGVGSATLQLIRAHRHLRYVVQERPKVVPAGVKVCLDVDKKRQFVNLDAQFWEHEDPEALKSGRVELMGKASTAICFIVTINECSYSTRFLRISADQRRVCLLPTIYLS